MLDSNTIKILIKDAQKALKERHIYDALYSMREICNEIRYASLRSSTDSLIEDYSRMLDYWEKGVSDPAREKIFESFMRRAIYLVENAWYIYLGDQFKDWKYGVDSMYLYNGPESAKMNDCIRLFYYILDYPPLDEALYEYLRKALHSKINTSDHIQMAMSALTLSCLNVFDSYKLSLLLEYANSDDIDIDVRARCLVGVVLVCIAHEWKIPYFPDISFQLSLLAVDAHLYADLKTIQLQLLLSLNTMKDSRRMNDKIIPDMMRAFDEVIKLMKDKDGNINFEDPFVLENLELDFNPDWTAGGNDAMRRTMNEFMSIQEKGADMFYSTFSTMMQRFPFFRTAANWFSPFTLKHPSFNGTGDMFRRMEVLFSIRKSCNTEKYAYCFLFSTLTEKAINHIFDNIANTQGISENLGEKGSHDTRSEAMQTSVRAYIQDIYRFFTLYERRGADMLNPFTLNLHLDDCGFFKAIAGQTNFMVSCADFCFSEKSWGDALSYLERIPEPKRNAEVYEKMGYSCYRQNDYDMAAEYFERANMLRPDSRWTLRQLAKTYISNNNYSKALVSLHQLERMDGDNEETLLLLGECHILQGNSELAFEKLYKAEYLHPGLPTWRALAWCSLVFHKPKQASEFYARILASENTKNKKNKENGKRADHYNAAHAAWVSGDIPQAIEHYLTVLDIDDKDFASSTFFDEDKKLLHDYGLTDSDFVFMRDAINRRKANIRKTNEQSSV